MSNQISCPLALSTSPRCPGPTARAHTHACTHHIHTHVSLQHQLIHMHTGMPVHTHTCKHICTTYAYNSRATHLHPYTCSYTYKRLQHTLTQTHNTHTHVHTQNTLAHAHNTLIHAHTSHTYSLALSHGAPKSASRPFDASSPASHFPDRPLSSGQEQRQPDRLLLSCSGRCSAHMTLGNYGLRPSVKPEAEVGDPGVSLWPTPYPPPKRTIL